MKKLIPALLLVLALAGCSRPNSLQLDLYQGYGAQKKLLHLNASTQLKRQRIDALAGITQDAKPLGKDLSLFAYYPDYLLEINREGVVQQAVVDLNGDFVDFHFLGEEQLYRSAMTAADFKKLLHQRTN